MRIVTLIIVLGLAVNGCSSSTGEPETTLSGGFCREDHSCSVGMECVGGGCVDNRPTLYSHIQLASPLLRSYHDASEVTWRGANSDLAIGLAIKYADELRAVNPNIRLFEYVASRYYITEEDGAQWAQNNGKDVEAFYLHYREDVYRSDWGSTVLVSGFAPGVIPGWNPSAGPDDPPASATSVEQSRVVGMPVGATEPWYLANLANPDYRAYLADYSRRVLDGSVWGGTAGQADGLIVDHAIYYAQFNEGMIDKTAEFHGLPLDEDHPYADGHHRFLVEVRDHLAQHFVSGIDVMPNFGHAWWLTYSDRNAQEAQQSLAWAWGEVWMAYRGGSYPTSGGTRVISYENDYDKGINAVIRQTRAGARRVLGARDLVGGGTGSDRGRIFTLALYYLLHNPNTYYNYNTFNHHTVSQDPQTHLALSQYNPAVTFDIGFPDVVPPGYVDFEGRTGTKEHFVFASGADPFDPSLTYRVLARRFTTGLVLAKMLPQGSVVDDRSITRHALDRSYKVLGADGLPAGVVTEVELRNNEAVILIAQ